MEKKLQQDHFKVSVSKKEEAQQYLQGRGAQINTRNRFLKNETVREHIEAIDDWEEVNVPTQYQEQEAKTIVNKVESPDVGMGYSMNAYAGCEHGCIYCYARNVHEYWGYSAGLDFERKIIVKTNAPQLLRKQLMHPKWEPVPIMLSGNTDCYQPAEKKYRLTRGLLEVCNEFNQPVGILTKNAGILKDKDVLQEMAKKNIVRAMVSITSFNEDLRRVMEPRTTTAQQRLKVIEDLSNAGVTMGIMMGPMIPGLNEHEMQRIMKAASERGATFTAYTFIRLNGAIKFLFHDWLYKNFPDRADKIWHLIEQSHDGKVNDSRWGLRMRGEGHIAQMIAQQYARYGKLYHMNEGETGLSRTAFRRPGQQGTLF
ncbi:PA0069 family radical SAM protein [Niabella drilacis]|uniref:DNA repair photolyase n=1 Tax=Niabella drilacis (strain DSM 25811 / CCM 8410 / CCUG 62505 / LMG 26954 / E90) TaxID=1285928 RepID=A0A1G6UVX4_NIADE|nr:PA0069 family radical SAM protein [Niabella drilacis]SDD45492.1 DNA repair photolyase [Niabella drilacis]